MKQVNTVEMLKAVVVALGFGGFGGPAWDGLDSLTLSEFREAREEIKDEAEIFINESGFLDSVADILDTDEAQEYGDEVREELERVADSYFYQNNIGILVSKDKVLERWDVLVGIVSEGWGCKFGEVVKFDDFGDLEWEHWADVIDMGLLVDSLCVLSSYLVEHNQVKELEKCETIEDIINLLYD